MRTRLIVAFIVVALLAALATVWFNNLIVPFYGWPSWLGGWITWPSPLIKLLYHRTPHHPGTMPHPGPVAVISFFLASVGLLLALMTGVAVAASRRVLRPVRRLAQAAQRMSGGDLSVRIEPQGPG